jgi:peptide-methionine (S)-S-oxide reductase
MTSRILVAAIAGVLAIGLTNAQAQKDNGPVRKAQPESTTADSQEPASAGDETTTASPEAAASKDPFDSAAARLKAIGTKSLGSDGKSDPAHSSKGKTEKATFGAGCFWHVESEFEWLPGVKSAVSGYSGGTVANPSYEEVHEGVTGHAEVVQVEYDPAVISYEQLLKVFWSGHDPTQLNRQGPDVGTQYRSVIFYHSPEQRQAALKSYRELTAGRVFPGPIVTQLMPMKAFFRAEEYHQNYYGGKDGRPAVRGSRSRRVRKPAVKSTAAKPAAKSTADSTKPVEDADGATPAASSNLRPRTAAPAEPES